MVDQLKKLKMKLRCVMKSTNKHLKMSKAERQKRLSEGILIFLLAAGLVSLLGGSYLTLFYAPKKTGQNSGASSPPREETSNKAVNTTSSNATSSAQKEEKPALARLDVVLDNHLSLSYPLAWQNQITGIWPKILSPLKDYKARTLLQLSDDKAKINVSVNSYLLDENFNLNQFAEKFNQALESNGFKIMQSQPAGNANVFIDDLLISNNNLNYRLYYKLIPGPVEDNQRKIYLVAASSLEKDFLDNLAELSNLLDSARAK